MIGQFMQVARLSPATVLLWPFHGGNAVVMVTR